MDQLSKIVPRDINMFSLSTVNIFLQENSEIGYAKAAQSHVPNPNKVRSMHSFSLCTSHDFSSHVSPKNPVS